ncbi:MAG: exo-alpha-sialidase [Thermoactinospora sp.]|nr:exo-alpha-sialidase [Thermoactinospora sp.]
MDAPVTVYGKVSRRPDGELAHEGNRVPDVVALDPRTFVVAWRAGVPGKDQGSILCARSNDAGRTWAVSTLAAGRYHYVILLHDAGTLYAFLGRVVDDPNRDGFPVELVARRSRDRGASWSDFPVSVDVPRNSRGVVLAARPVRHQGRWLLPYWQQGGAGVLRSADLASWRRGGLARPPRQMMIEEPQVVVSQDDPGTLLMMARTLDLRGGGTLEEKDRRYRAHAAYAATATSTDGGTTWSPMVLDPDIPNFYVKGFLGKDSHDRYLAIYNTLGGPFQGERPDRYREVLHYKTKRPGQAWSPGLLFADGGRLTGQAARGWDVYASADEYEPGRFVVVWEHNQTNIKVVTLDLDTPVPGLLASFEGPLDLRGSVSKPIPRCDFAVEFRGEVLTAARLDPATGEGVSMGVKVANGAKRLMLTVQHDAVWVMTKGSARWSHLVDHPGGTATWRVVADSAGAARLFRDGADTGASWVIQDSGERPQATHWVSGARCRLEFSRVTSRADPPDSPQR